MDIARDYVIKTRFLIREVGEMGLCVRKISHNIMGVLGYPPEVVRRKMRASLGAFSGGAVAKIKLQELGIPVKEEKIPSIVQKVKELTIQKRGGMSDDDFKLIASEV